MGGAVGAVVGGVVGAVVGGAVGGVDGGGVLQSMVTGRRRSATADVAARVSGTTWACTLRPLSPV